MIEALDAYFGSIGGWKKQIANEQIVEKYFRFKEKRISELANDFLRKNEIDPIWR